MTLNQIERETALWKKVETEITSRLQVAREKNDGDLSVEATFKTRGTIAAYKEILGWAKPTTTYDGD